MKINVLLEIPSRQENAFAYHTAMVASESESFTTSESFVQNLTGYGLEVRDDFPPVPLFGEEVIRPTGGGLTSFSAFASPDTNPDVSSEKIVISCEVEKSRLADMMSDHQEIVVWPNSQLTLMDKFANVETPVDFGTHPFDLASSKGGVDCHPYRPGVDIDTIRQLLAVEAIWRDGFRGQNIVVGILDEGVNGQVYPVVGGYSRPGAKCPGTAAITSHGSMCAADVLVAAPAAKIYDYPFLGIPDSGGALQMFQAVLDQRRRDGTPHLTNNSYGFRGVPNQQLAPRHEIWNLDHPVHRKVREVIASGAAAFFAAGNCGENCPSGACFASGIGPGRSIHASNSLAEVITVAAVNSRHERIGYSSQGPGMFESNKPDIASYSHLFGNFGPNRPGGLAQPFDNGTSAATPVAAGVAALLMSAIAGLSPQDIKQALIESSIDIGKPGFDYDTGYGVVNAGSAYAVLKRKYCGQ